MTHKAGQKKIPENKIREPVRAGTVETNRIKEDNDRTMKIIATAEERKKEMLPYNQESLVLLRSFHLLKRLFYTCDEQL